MDPLASTGPTGGMAQPAAPAAPANPAPVQNQQPPAPPPVQYPNIPLHPPSGNMPRQPVAPQAPQQPTDAFTAEQLVQEYARATGLDPEYIRQRSQGNPLAWSASLARDAIGTLREQQAAARQVPAQPTAQSQTAPAQPELPDWWESAVHTNPQTGLYEPIRGEYQGIANLANAEQMRRAHQFQQIQKDPSKLMTLPAVQQMLKQQIDNQMAQARQQWETENLHVRMREKYGKDIIQHNQSGQPIIGFDGKPEMTPLGFAFAKHYSALMEQGMKESQVLYDTAITLARNEYGAQQAAANIQNQPMSSNAFGIPAQPVQGYGQPVYGQQPVNNVLQNAQTYWPGQPPIRQNQPVGNVPFEAVAHQAIAELPEGRSAAYYINELLGSNRNGDGW